MDPKIQELIEAHNSGKISRRDFVRRAAVLLSGAVITGTAIANSSASNASAAQSTPGGTMVATLADNPSAKILTKMVEFDTNGSSNPKAPGYLAYPDGAGPFPAVVIIQEWWGLDKHIKAVTELMARNGYAALAPDLYRGEVAQEPAEAQKLAMALIMDQAIKDIQGAADYLTTQDFVGPKKAGIVGFCFGGGLAWQMAWNGKDNIGPIVAFYGLGGLDITKVDLSTVKVPVLGLFGGADQSNPPEKIKQWEDKLKELGKTNEMVTYPGAPHAFFNDTRPSYRADAAKDALNRTLDWFNKYLIGSEMATPAAAPTQGS